MTTKFKVIPCEDDTLLRLSKTELVALGSGKSKKAEAARNEVERRKHNKAVKNAALKAAGLR